MAHSTTRSSLERLKLFLRPAGQGIPTVSTGMQHTKPLWGLMYGSQLPDTVTHAWEERLAEIGSCRAVVLGVPSDSGAGILRGASFGPLGIRLAYLAKYRSLPKHVVDIGDVLSIPQLLHDSMLCEDQLRATRSAIYPAASNGLPVSPLSIAEAALDALYQLNPDAKIFLLGGDHSIAWPAVLACKRRFEDKFAILHFDAHTDLMSERYGVQYCFATWARHALELIRPGQLIQVGIRTSGHTKDYWENALPVKQFWATYVNRNEQAACAAIIDQLAELSPNAVYISNDIDGTDPTIAPATGTPEQGGLSDGFVRQVINEIGKRWNICGADVVEVAPVLSGGFEFETEPTCVTAATYLRTSLEAAGLR